ncbi:MAG: hypothetical protein KatS3mg010_0588 [Acidimicrobiia bacterium]|nr:MAG: hypothetical protein KatS3mg010_0588 [Acidimicrobiia bacterium]
MELFELPEFAAGLAAGAIFAFLAGLPGMVSALLGTRRSFPLGGVAFVVAAIVALDSDAVPVFPALALGGIAAAAAARALVGTTRAVLAAAPFAGVLALGFDPDGTWLGSAVFVGAAVVSVVVASFEDVWRAEPIGPAMFALSVLGVALSVPDTEHVAALAGAVLPVAAFGWPLGLLRWGRAGSGASVALVVWVGAIDSRARPASFLATIACFGLLLAFPIAEWLRQRRSGLRPLVNLRFATGSPDIARFRDLEPSALVVLTIAVHGAFVLGAARLAGGFESVAATAIVASTCLVCALAVAIVLGSRARGTLRQD